MNNLTNNEPEATVVLKLLSDDSASNTKAALLLLGLHKENMTEVIIREQDSSLTKITGFTEVNANLLFHKDEKGFYTFLWLQYRIDDYAVCRVGCINKDTSEIETPEFFNDYLISKLSQKDFFELSDKQHLGDPGDMFELSLDQPSGKKLTLKRIINVEAPSIDYSEFEFGIYSENHRLQGRCGDIVFSQRYVYIGRSKHYSSEPAWITIVSLIDDVQPMPSSEVINHIAKNYLFHKRRKGYCYIVEERLVSLDSWNCVDEYLEKLVEDYNEADRLEELEKEKRKKEEQEKEKASKAIHPVEKGDPDIPVSKLLQEKKPKGPENPDNHNLFYNSLAIGLLIVMGLLFAILKSN